MNISSPKKTFHARILGISTFISYLSRNTRITLKQAFFPTLVKRAAQISFLASHLPGHFQYLKVLSDAHRKNIIGNDQFIGQFIRYKYLGTYLIRSMKMIDRLRALTFHYSFLCKKLVEANQDSFLKDGIVIWHKKCEESADDFQIVLEPSTSFEGELALRFVMNSLTLFTLAFLIIPGRTINLPHEKVMFIGGIQGVLGRRQEIRHAAKNNGEIDPSSVLLIAAKAIAKALGVDAIAGISSKDQAAIGYANGKLLLNYDAFWMSIGGTQIDNRFFVLAPNAEGKPLVEIPNKHRSRTKRKRLLKNEIQNDICLAFTKHLLLEGGAAPKHAKWRVSKQGSIFA